MVKIYSADINKINEEKLMATLERLPLSISTKINTYKDIKDRKLRILTKLMLTQLLKDFSLSYSLENIKYHTTHKPYIAAGFDFSSSHSGDIALCAATMQGAIGIDIEKICKINLEDYKDFFNPDEWAAIQVSPSPYTVFFGIWTKKEACMKANGKGVESELSDTNTLSHELPYHLHTLDIDSGYKAALACDFYPLVTEHKEFILK